MTKKAFIGVDLHTNNFTVCYLRANEDPVFKDFTINNNGIDEFKKTLSKKDEVAVESVSNAAYLNAQITERVKKVSVVATGGFSVISQSIKKLINMTLML